MFIIFYNTLLSLSHLHCSEGTICLANQAQVLRGAKATKQSHNFRGDCFVGKITLLAMTYLLAACLPLGPALPTETPIPTDIIPPTATIVWFPPSATPTQLTIPTYTGTPEMKPGVGSETLTDDFSNKKFWDTALSDQGSAAISRNRLSLAIQPGVYLSSFRRDNTFGNFYAEITARPSLCRGEDNYGVIVRGIGSSYYRFVLSCNAQVRAERVNGGIRLPLLEPVPSGDAPRGAPGQVVIGIWAVGSDMRLFLNGRYQFGIKDKSFPSGAIGVFVRSENDTPMSVTFSDLKVYDVDYVLPTSTPLP